MFGFQSGLSAKGQQEQRLLKLFRQLDAGQQASLLDFAEFLQQRATLSQPAAIEQPLEIPRPDDESVIGAIKRLSKSYFMLERDKMLRETSDLMSAHLLQGREAVLVIDDLEALFRSHYADYLKSKGAE